MKNRTGIRDSAHSHNSEQGLSQRVEIVSREPAVQTHNNRPKRYYRNEVERLQFVFGPYWGIWLVLSSLNEIERPVFVDGESAG